MHHADVCADPHQYYLLWIQGFQSFCQVRLVKSAVPTFLERDGHVVRQLWDYFTLLGPSDAMHGEHLELQVIGVVGVGNEDDAGACSLFALDQSLDVGDYLTGFIATVQVLPRLHEADEHVHNKHHVAHNSPLLLSSTTGCMDS